jgi:hypothetical protein
MKTAVYINCIQGAKWIETHGAKCLEVIRKYFSENNHEILINCASCSQELASWQWLLCHKIFSGYDFILTWNLDILPQKKEDIFNDLDLTKMCACVESDGNSIDFPHYKYNCGLVGVPVSEAKFCEEVYVKWSGNPKRWPSYEQYYWNFEVGEQKKIVHEISKKYNLFCGSKDQDAAVCVHFSGFVYKDGNEPSALPRIDAHHERIMKDGFR